MEETAEDTVEDIEDTADDEVVSGASAEVSSEEEGNNGSTVETDGVEETGSVGVEAGLEDSTGSDGISQEETASDTAEDAASDETAEAAEEISDEGESFEEETPGREEAELCGEELLSPEI